MASNYNDILMTVGKGNQLGLSSTIRRNNGIPLDFSSIQATYDAALNYAKSPIAYIGQLITVEDTLYIVTTPEAGYLKAIGTKNTNTDKSISISDEGIISIYGFSAASDATIPKKNADGTISWVTLAEIASATDTNTKTLIKTADNSDITITQVYNEKTDTRTYTLDVQFPAIADYSVSKSSVDNNIIYKMTKNGAATGEAIIVPNAYDDTEILDTIKKLQEYFTTGAANKAISYTANGDIDREFKRLNELISGLAGADTDFLQELCELSAAFNQFIDGSSADNIINTLSEIRNTFESLQQRTASIETAANQNKIDITAVKNRITTIEGITHHEHNNKAELDLIKSGDVEKWNALENYDDTQVTDDLRQKADKTYVDTNLAKKVSLDGYTAFSQEEKNKLAGLANYNDTALHIELDALKDKFTGDRANDAARLGNQLPSYYATAASVEKAISDTHTHDNKDIIDAITQDTITSWNSAEQNAKAHAKEYTDTKIDIEKTRASTIETGLEARLSNLETISPITVEASDNNGNIKINSNDVTIYDDAEICTRVETLEEAKTSYALKTETESTLKSHEGQLATVQKVLADVSQEASDNTTDIIDIKLALGEYSPDNTITEAIAEGLATKQDLLTAAQLRLLAESRSTIFNANSIGAQTGIAITSAFFTKEQVEEQLASKVDLQELKNYYTKNVVYSKTEADSKFAEAETVADLVTNVQDMNDFSNINDGPLTLKDKISKIEENCHDNYERIDAAIEGIGSNYVKFETVAVGSDTGSLIVGADALIFDCGSSIN